MLASVGVLPDFSLILNSGEEEAGMQVQVQLAGEESLLVQAERQDAFVEVPHVPYFV